MPGSCHGHGDTLAAPGHAPRGSVAGPEFRMRTRGGLRSPLPIGTLGTGLPDFQLTASPREAPWTTKKTPSRPSPPLQGHLPRSLPPTHRGTQRLQGHQPRGGRRLASTRRAWIVCRKWWGAPTVAPPAAACLLGGRADSGHQGGGALGDAHTPGEARSGSEVWDGPGLRPLWDIREQGGLRRLLDLPDPEGTAWGIAPQVGGLWTEGSWAGTRPPTSNGLSGPSASLPTVRSHVPHYPVSLLGKPRRSAQRYPQPPHILQTPFTNPQHRSPETKPTQEAGGGAQERLTPHWPP